MGNREIASRKTKIITALVEIAGVKLYTVQAIADAFGVNKITILRHIKNGSLGARLIGHKYFITEEQLKNFLNTPCRIKIHAKK